MLQGLFIAIFFQSLVLAMLCFTTKHKTNANKWLGAFFLSTALQRLFHLVLTSSQFFHQFPIWLFLFDAMVIAELFFLQCFVFAILNKPLRRPMSVALMALCLQVGIFLFGFFMQFWAGVAAFYHHPIYNVINMVVFAYIAYVVVSSLANIKKGLLTVSFNDSRSRLILYAARWLLFYRTFRMCFALLFLFVRMSAKGDMLLVNQMEYVYLLIVNLLLILLLGYTAYFSLRNPQFFDNLTEHKAPNVEEQIMLAVIPESEKKIIRMDLPPDEVVRLNEKLKLCMETQRPWLDNKLTLPRLAAIAGIPAYKISRLIKQSSGLHFSEYINQQRVQYAQTLLADPQRALHTIYAIALDSGFASEAPFYAAFKKITGLSPAAWREQQNNS
jgi:AraC-like DNA-binding protein